MAFQTSREHFEHLVDAAIERLPRRFKRRLKNITVIVEDYPSKEVLSGTGFDRDSLLGLFTGVPYSQRGGFFEIPYPMPEEIILFQRNLESICSSETELKLEITKTIIHEVGHYFGLSEEELRKYE